jgi:hypothetical protein
MLFTELLASLPDSLWFYGAIITGLWMMRRT